MKTPNRKQAGFTLIELIVVIVILGLLAVTAAPRFLNLQGDARAATLEAVKGSVKSAQSIVYAKAVIQGRDGLANTSVAISNGAPNIAIAFGYPQANSVGIFRALDIEVGAGRDFLASIISGTPNTYVIRAANSTAPTAIVAGNGTAGQTNDGCYVAYTQAANATTPPVVTINTDDCK